MTFLPIVEREMRTRARRAATHWSRWAVAVAGSLAVFQVFSGYAAGGNLTMTGQAAYASLAAMAFVLACAAALLTADSVSAERREGTLGLLFLTDLKGYDVILGKLAATGLDGFYMLLGFAPALALPLLAGGVTGGELFRKTLALLNVLFVTLAAGLWVSTRAQIQFLAMRNSLLLVVGLMVGPWFLFRLLPASLSTVFSVNMSSPYYSFRVGSDLLYNASGAAFWCSLVATHLEAWILLLVASRAIARNWRNEVRVKRTRSEKATRRAELASNAAVVEPIWRPSLGDGDPIVWRARQLPRQSTTLWVAALVWSLPWILMWLLYLNTKVGTATLLSYGVTAVTHFGSAALITWAAGRFFTVARHNGELELLMSTPVGARNIVSGQWAALWDRLRWPLLFVLFTLTVPLGVQALTRGLGPLPFGVFVGLLNCVIAVANTMLSVLALCWVGMWFSLRAPKPIVAGAWTVGLVCGLPWLVTGVFQIGLRMSGLMAAPGGGVSPGFIVAYFAAPLLGLAINLCLLRWAKERLSGELRIEPLPPFSELLKQTPAVVAATLQRVREWPQAGSK